MTDNKKKYSIIGGVLCLAGVTAAVYALTRKSIQVVEDNEFKEAPKVALKEHVPSPAAKDVKGSSSATTSATTVAASSTKNTDAAVSERTTTITSPTSTAKILNDSGIVEFKEYFCSLKPVEGWSATNEPAPMPNIALIVLKRPEFEAMQQQNPIPGAVPAVIFSIEDISHENLTVAEMKDKSKEIATQQLAMMTGGAIQPNIIFDGPQKVGTFEYCLEFQQNAPPYLSMNIINYFKVKNGLSYTFQYIAAPDAYATYKPAVMQMIKSVVIDDETGPALSDFTKDAYVRTSMNGIMFKAHPSWTLKAGTAACAVEIMTGSQAKPELIQIYREEESPHFPTTTQSKTIDGCTIRTYTEGKKEKKVISGNGYIAVLSPLLNKTSWLDIHQVIVALKSIVIHGEKNEKPVREFVTEKYGFEFPATKEGGFSNSKIGGGTVIYAPAGIKAISMGDDVPIVTLRVGSPNTDKTCEPTLDAWKERLYAEDGNITQIVDTTLGGYPAITFTTEEMVESGPGQKTETICVVVIAVRADGTTALIRWESSTGAKRRYEREMKRLLDEIRFF